MFKDFFYPHGIDEEGEFMPFLSMNDDEDEMNLKEDIPGNLPILALKNTVLFPGIVIPITVGRDKSIRAVHHAYESGRLIAVLSQRSAKTEDPIKSDLFQIGTIARILKILKMPDGTTTAILQGRRRFSLEEMTQENPFLSGKIEVIGMVKADNQLEFTATIASIKDLAQQIIKLAPNIPSDAAVMLKNIDNGAFLLNFITSTLGIDVPSKQTILEINDLSKKAEAVLVKMDNELQLLQLKDKIETKVRTDLEKQQRDYFLNQQLKTIQDELGDNPQDKEYGKLKERAAKMKWPAEIKEVFDKDLKKLKRLNPQVAEYSVMLNYMELMLDLPWSIYTEDNFDLKKVKKVLDLSLIHI